MTDIMGDRRRVEDEAQLPPTGMPTEIEHAFSSIFVEPFAMPVLVTFPCPKFRPLHPAVPKLIKCWVCLCWLQSALVCCSMP